MANSLRKHTDQLLFEAYKQLSPAAKHEFMYAVRHLADAAMVENGDGKTLHGFYSHHTTAEHYKARLELEQLGYVENREIDHQNAWRVSKLGVKVFTRLFCLGVLIHE